MTTATWEWAVDSPVWLKPRRTLYFLIRHLSNGIEYRNDKRGRLITYRTREQAMRIVDKLNGVVALCANCGAGLTTTDQTAGYCTQCQTPIRKETKC